MSIKLTRVFLALPAFGAVFAAGACSDVRDAVYQQKAAPDEFAVYRRAPLSLPPEYTLRPPAPGADPRNSLNPQGQARQAVFGAQKKNTETVKPPVNASAGTVALLRRAGALNAEPGIRNTVDRETSILALESESLADDIMFWKEEQPFGTVVDPQKEQSRVQGNQALGKPVNEGETPTIERSSSTFEKMLEF
ncbi:MAG: DUF3035 domain-containing protein [Rhodospirillales bacterium]